MAGVWESHHQSANPSYFTESLYDLEQLTNLCLLQCLIKWWEQEWHLPCNVVVRIKQPEACTVPDTELVLNNGSYNYSQALHKCYVPSSQIS